MPKIPGWKKLVTTGSHSWSPSLDGLRKKLAKGLEVRVDQPEVRRGDEIEALVVVTEPDRLGELEAGLVCTEQYDEETYTGSDSGASRMTCKAVEHEAWQPLPSMAGEHSVRLAIPANATFSYESYRFELALPPEALPNLTSGHGQLYWRLDVKSDERGRDSHELRRIDVDC